MTRFLRTSIAPLALAALLSGPGASAQTVDLTGDWVLTVESPNGTGTRQATFVQDGEDLTGTISSSMASGELRGRVEGTHVTFTALVMMDTGAFEVDYVCTFEDGRLIDGTVDFGEYGSGTFTGRRKEPSGGGR